MGDVKISWNDTKKNIERLAEKYNLYTLSVCMPQESLEENYKLKLISASDIVEKYIKIPKDEILKRIDFINYVRFSYNKLTSDERKIIYWTYFDRENRYDDRYIANNLGFSLGYYYIKKKDTLIRFAFSLGIEVE
ncbi:MAG: hypothetical protein MR296_02545 [Tenericutes bacterium]|nr:hypothetical protein [Mycoplasmatota bacterium]